MKYLKESKEDKERFINWYIDSTIEEEEREGIPTDERHNYEPYARAVVDNFIKLKPRIKSPYNDFYYWIKNASAIDLDRYLDKLDTEIKKRDETKTQEKDGARLVYSDNDWKVYEITTYEASAKYGKNTKWCITGSKRWVNDGNGREYWDSYYSKDGIKFYFFIKSNDEKYALAVYPGDKYCEIYNSEDVSIPFIPNAPLVDEIKVNYSDNSAGNILINAIMTKKISEDVLFDVFEEVIDDNKNEQIYIFSKNQIPTLISTIDDWIPEGWVEHEYYAYLLESGLSYEEVAQKCKEETGEDFEEYWGGDLPLLNDLFNFNGSTKEEVLKSIEKKCDGNDYIVLCENPYEGGYDIEFIKDWVALFQFLNYESGVQDWDESDIDDFFEDNPLGGSRASIFAVMCANQLIWDIKQGTISRSVLNGLGLPDDYLKSEKESFDNLLDDSTKVSRIVLNEDKTSNMYYHGSMDKIEGDLNSPINWVTNSYEYAKTYAIGGYVYTCDVTLGNLFDVGKVDTRVYDLLPIRPYKLSREFEAIVRKLNLNENVVKKLLDNIIDEYKFEANGYKMTISSVVRSTSFKRLLEGLGYDGIKAIEHDKINNKDVDTFGIFDKVKIIKGEKVNESLVENYFDFKFTKEDLQDYLDNDSKYSKKLSKPNSDGPMIVLPNGDVYDISMYETHANFAGALADTLGYDNYDDDFDGDALDYIQDKLHIMTLNPGDHEFEERLKVVCSNRPTERQFDVLRDFIDYMQMKYRGRNLPLYCYISNMFMTYPLAEYISDEIIKKIRLGFVRGRLEESRKAITWGDLDYAKKTDTRGIMMNGRGTGHFGTGFYFVGANGPYGLNGSKYYDYEPSRPIYEIDLDAYNLFKPSDNDTAYKIHDAMREINNCYEPSLNDWINKDFDIDKLEDELFQIGWNAQEVYEDLDDDLDDLDLDIDDLDDLVDDKEELSDEELDRRYEENYRKGVKEFIKKYGLEEYVWKDIDNEKIGVIENHVKDAILRKYDSIKGLEYALRFLSKIFNVSEDKLLNIIKEAYNNKSLDTISTQIFKALGYEGVDVTHLNHDAQGLSGLDNFSYGTVIYDLKPGTFKRIKEPREDKSGHYKAKESLKEYFDTIEGDWPIYVTDDVYRVKNMIENNQTPYRIFYDHISYFIQNARGDKTHFDMLDRALELGLIDPSSSVLYQRDDGKYILDIDDDDGYMVFIPKGFHGSLRYFTSLGSDSYYDCRVYPFGVMFVRNSEAFYNGLFDALGEPEREISYDSWDEMVYLTINGKTKEYNVDDLNGDPNNAIDLDIKKESLVESKDDILSVVEKEIGTSDRPIDGPSYILPNGKFLTIWKSKIPVSKYSATGSAIHRDVQDFLYNKGLVKDKGIDVDDPELEKLGCIRVNSGFEEYIWLPNNRPNEIQWNSLLMWLDWYFRFHHKLTVGFKNYAPKTYYDKDYTTDEILKKCKEAYARGYLTEDINKYYRLEIEDAFGNREGLWTGSFNLIPTKETIENYPEDFEELTQDERRNYYQFDYLLNKLSKIKSPGVDTNFNGFRANDIFAFTSNKYAEIKDIINEMRQVLKELGFKLIVKELDVDDVEISYRDDDQIAFHKSELEKELEEKIVKKGSKWQVQSEKGKNLGTYDTKKEAEDRLKQVHYFKHINESKQDIEKFRQWAGDELANRFFAVKQRLEGKYKDIYHYIGLEKDTFERMIKHDRWKNNQEQAREYAHKVAIEELTNAIEYLERTPTRKEVDAKGKEGAEKVYEDGRWLVMKINTYEASVKYGKHTQWCITGTNSQADGGRADWENHTEDGEQFYFYIDKQKDRKYALEFKDMHNWAFYVDDDYVDVGEGQLFNNAIIALGDYWNPAEYTSYPAIPTVEGLPNIQQAYRDAIEDHNKEFPEDNLNVDDFKVESLNEDLN